MTSLSMFVLFVLGVVVTVYATSVDLRGELIFSHILYRHGDRTPVMTYPTDPYSDASNWPMPLGVLTNTGKQQHFALGQWLRQRYGNVLLSEHYTPKEIYIRSTNSDRTLQSSESNLAGLYPPQGKQIWNDDIEWQPIPVHTVADGDDWLIGGLVPACPAYDEAMHNLDTSSEFLELLNESQVIIQYITDNSGFQIPYTSAGLRYIMLVRDTLFVEDLYNFTLPEWTKKVYPGVEIDNLSKLYYNIPSYTPVLAKIRSGFLIKDILDRSTLKNDGTLLPNLSVVAYSTHDIIISSLLYALGILNNDFVHYAACLLFELRSTPTGPRIEIFYKKSSETDVATPLYIPHCGFSCPVDKFYELYNDIIPTDDFANTCQIVKE